MKRVKAWLQDVRVKLLELVRRRRGFRLITIQRRPPKALAYAAAALLSAFLAASAAGETLPQTPEDVSVREVDEYLNQEIRKERARISTLDSSTYSYAMRGASNTFTQANTFGSTVTIGYQTINTTASYSAVLDGGWSVVASTDVCGVAQVDFTQLFPAVAYRYTITILQAGLAGIPQWRINGDVGANYGYGNAPYRYASGADNAQADGATAAQLIGGNSVAVGDTAYLTGTFRTQRGDATLVRGTGSVQYISGGSGSGGSTSFTYNGAVNLHSAQFRVSAGTFCMSAVLEALVIDGVPGAF